MIPTLLSKYFPVKPFSIMPLEVDVLTPGDYHLYLLMHKNDWIVIAEADYLSSEMVPQDIEGSFPVTVAAWCVLRDHQEEIGSDTLSANYFSVNDEDETDEGWRSYKATTFKDYGMTYAVLRVTPKEGVDENIFQLSYQSGSRAFH